jgi:peptide-methionine (S)-S-oxide reductase
VVRTRVGYAGGTKENPTYHSLGDHTEAIQIDYDPTRISYEELLEIFWDSHDPAQRPFSRQYMSILFYHNEEQKRLAMQTRDRAAAEAGGPIHTEIRPASDFYLAEAYHQKYLLQQVPELMAEFNAMYPTPEDFVASTAAARANGYVGGYGSTTALQEALDDLGLSPAGNQTLQEFVRGSER